MPQRTAKVAQEYAGRPLNVGDVFDVEQPHVRLLLTLGRIEPVEGEDGYVARELEPEAPEPYLTRDLSAERPKRAYTRKGAAQ